MDKELQEICEKAVKTWTETTLSRDDLAGYIDKILTHSIFPKMLTDAATMRTWKAVEEEGHVSRYVKQWATKELDVVVPAAIVKRYQKAIQEIDAQDLLDSLKADQMTVHRMHLSGMEPELIATHLKISTTDAKRLLKRAIARVKFLRKQLSGYGA